MFGSNKNFIVRKESRSEQDDYRHGEQKRFFSMIGRFLSIINRSKIMIVVKIGVTAAYFVISHAKSMISRLAAARNVVVDLRIKYIFDQICPVMPPEARAVCP